MPELGEGWSAETKAASRAGEGDWTGPAAAVAAASPGSEAGLDQRMGGAA